MLNSVGLKIPPFSERMNLLQKIKEGDIEDKMRVRGFALAEPPQNIGLEKKSLRFRFWRGSCI